MLRNQVIRKRSSAIMPVVAVLATMAPAHPVPSPRAGDECSRLGTLAAGAGSAVSGLSAVCHPDTLRPAGLDLPVVEDTLANGLRVLALRRPGAPTVSFVLRFDVGSGNEAAGETGIAHFVEHLLFKGTTTIGTTSHNREQSLFRTMDVVHDSLLALRAAGGDPAEVAELRGWIRGLEERARDLVLPAELDRILTEAGGRGLNATTGTDGTRFFVQLPANRAELWFVVEADRMANPVFREFYAERDVVLAERSQQIEASPAGRLAEAFYSAAYRVHPYGVPVIGHRSDIELLTRAQVEEFHRRYYRPGNAVIAAVGDIDPARILALARRYFGAIPAGEPPPPVRVVEPPQREERRVEVVFDAAPELMVGWHVSAGTAPDAAAVGVLGQVLAGGRTSRLHRRLVVEERLASSVSFGLGPGYRYPRMLTLGAQPLPGRTTAELESAIYHEIDRLLREPPTAHELQRIQNQMEAAEVHRLASSLGLAFQLAEAAALRGDWRETFLDAGRSLAVTAADVQEVARRYLTRENRTVAVLVRGGH